MTNGGKVLCVANKKQTVALLSIILSICGFLVVGCTLSEAASTETGGQDDHSSNQTAAAWTIDSACETCHTFEADSAANANTLYAIHAEHESMNVCNDCHTDIDGNLAKAHEGYTDEGAKPATRLKETQVSESICTASGCHDINELIEATSDYQDIVDVKGTVINPHMMIIDEHHMVGGDSSANTQCASCHKMHAQTFAAIEYCYECHHMQVFECNTCH